VKNDNILDRVYEKFVDLSNDPSPIKERARRATELAERSEHDALEHLTEEKIACSTIFTMAAEIYTKLAEKAFTNRAKSDTDTRNLHFQHWSRYLNITDKWFEILRNSNFNLPTSKLTEAQDSLITVMIRGEEFGFAPTDEELQSKLPEETLKKLQDILAF
jgi:hypothetical protein